MEEIEAPASDQKKRRVLAAVLSAAVPGMGQLILRRKREGLVLLATFCILLVLHWPVRLATSYWGLQILLFGTIFLFVFAAWRALRSRSVDSTAGSRAWLFLVVPFALLMSFLESTLFLRVAGLRVFEVPSTGMEHTIMKGDRIVADFQRYAHARPGRGDVIVFERANTFYVKRVIAVGGSVISGKNNVIVLDDSPLDENYTQHTGNALPELKNFGPISIPPGRLFVMGDNRDVSLDSRMPTYGLVTENTVLGRALYVLSSRERSLVSH